MREISEPSKEFTADLLGFNLEWNFCLWPNGCAICTKFFECTLPKKNEWSKNREQYVPIVSSVERNMGRIKHKVAILSGKGGVGKSSVTTNLAAGLAQKGYRVGVLDSDFGGPSIAKMLGVRARLKMNWVKGIMPAAGSLGVCVVSMGSILNRKEPVLWRADLKESAIQQFLGYVYWGDLDYLLIDLPPGTSDETLNIFQLLPNLDRAVIVTIPSEVSQEVVGRSLTFCKNAGIKSIGVLENMSGFVCPHCGEPSNIFMSGGGKKIADEFGVEFLGKIPLDERLCEASDSGVPFVAKYPEAKATKMIMNIVDRIESEDLLRTPSSSLSSSA